MEGENGTDRFGRMGVSMWLLSCGRDMAPPLKIVSSSSKVKDGVGERSYVSYGVRERSYMSSDEP